jgi:predicted aconitase with swiveling domain
MGLAHQQGNAPVAFINTSVDSLAVLGCVVNQIPMVSELGDDPFEVIHTGDHVVVDADQGMVVVTQKAAME